MDTQSVMQRRSKIRKQVRNTRRDLSGQQQHDDAKKLFARLIKHEKTIAAHKVAISLAHDGEIDTLAFIKWCWKNNKEVYLPVVHPFSKGHLLFLAYKEDSEMVLNRYGIYEPKLIQLDACPVDQLDIIFTPLVAFDLQGNRIGMGGGYYDRTLAPWFKNKTGPYPIGLAHDCQQLTSIPTLQWDVPLPEIITPNKHLKWE